ncbi:TonB-dependent receptor domain-containing protein [Pseudoalteromonas ardens]|uniref:TonB-dependent receptor n=1 Tax=Pseudoalteromonas rubra TaxID=43658 RepID=A0A0L0EWI1_9GAMM|nr:TonB-dependent receptor [Pseudoalteromonas sp. R96]KNC68792.1 TonB-dependent receptor [Pseudoalteromonas rubra]MDK1311387.1 TonB-dependent receptor [Pseudoalteromonas sp. R96]
MRNNKNNTQAIRHTLAASAIALAIGSAVPVFAADGNSLVRGNIVSGQGSELNEVELVFTHKAKGLTFSATTNAQGEYILRNLPVGQYQVTISKDGFESVMEEQIQVNIGQSVLLDAQLYRVGATDIERIAVSGTAIRRVDMASSTAGVTYTDEEIKAMPVNSGFESIALLAPGTAEPGGSEFKDASSFGGSSSAENGYYFNGLNVTSIRTGLGSIRLPWEAIGQTQVKTGGVSPEFGGALGGIVNAVSKSGDNDFKLGVEMRYDPDSLRNQHEAIYQQNGVVGYYTNTQQSTETFKELQVWASGALIEDSLFFYGLLAPYRENETWARQTVYNDREREEDRWFAKLDWFINQDHSIGFSAMNNKRTWETTSFAYDWETNVIGEQRGVAAPGEDGGKVYSLNYNGYINDFFSVSAVLGRVSENVENVVASTEPGVWDERDGFVTVSSHTASSVTEEEFVRDQFKLDFTWDLEMHSVSFGLDYSKITVDYYEGQNGLGEAQGWWTILTASEDDISGAPQGTDYIERRVRTREVDSDSTALAFYVNDSWQATDNLVLNLGFRYSEFENTVSDGRAFVDMKDQFAPRLQAIYDLHGDGSAKIFATYGRYFQPVSVNMNVTQGSSSIEWFEYYALDEVDANGLPVLGADGSPSRGAQLRDRYWRQRGITEPGLIASSSLKPMYSDEFTLGYQQEVFGDMALGIRAIYRDLGRSVEDTDVGPVLAKKLAEMGISDNVGQSSYYVLNNPGEAITMSYDFDGDGQVDEINLSAEELALQQAKRKYLALEFTLEGSLTDRLRINSSYTWSHSYGNTEGLVKTDNNQADPGWTTSYDYADLMDNGYGNLPNDHRHAFKFAGAYELTDEFTLGMVARAISGRPTNYLSLHPRNVDSCKSGSPWDACVSRDYGHVSHYDEHGNPAPRGSIDTLPWLTNIDLSMTYTTEISGHDLMLKATVYNLLNNDAALDITETRTRNSSVEGQELELNPDYGLVTRRQEERYISLVARFTF